MNEEKKMTRKDVLKNELAGIVCHYDDAETVADFILRREKALLEEIKGPLERNISRLEGYHTVDEGYDMLVDVRDKILSLIEKRMEELK